MIASILDLRARMLEAPLVVREPMQPLDAIVVLGATLGSSDSLSAVLAERVAAAVELWRAGGGKLVISTRGVTRGASRGEADVMAAALRTAGVADILVERESRTTAENARLTAVLLAPLGVRSVWLVTQPFHGRRAARLFRGAGFDAHVWHIADSLATAAAPSAGWSASMPRGRTCS